MTRPRRWLAVLVAGTALVVVPATAAAAHNVLVSTDPADGATVQVAPDSVLLTFDKPALALGTELVVTAPDGRDVAEGPPVLVDTTVRQPTAGPLPAGRYTVTWRVTSADGHPVSGSFTFTASRAAAGATGGVLAPMPTAAPAPGTAVGGSPRIGTGTTAVLVVVLVVAVLGAATAVALLQRRRRTPDPTTRAEGRERP